MVENQLGFLFGQIAESIRGGLGDIGKLKPNAFPAKIDDIVALIGTGGEPGGAGGSGGPLSFASGFLPSIQDGERVTIEHGLGVMPDLILVQVVNFLNFTNYEEAAATQAMMAAWGMRSSLGNGYHSGYVSTVWGLNKSYGIDNMPSEDQAFGYIFCPDEATFQVGSTGEVGKLYSKTSYRWLAISGIESGSGGSSADVRYVTFKSHDGLIEYGKKAVAVGDDCADPIARGVFSTPTRESDVQYHYTFYGWATEPNGAYDASALKAVTEDRVVYANFASAVRYYTITYYDSDGTTVLKTESLAYGAIPSYVPGKENYMFGGWTPNISAVTQDASYCAIWEDKITFSTGSWAKISEVCTAGQASEIFAVGDKRTETLTYADGTTEDVEFEIVDLNPSGIVSGTHMALLATHVLNTPQKYVNSNYTSSSTRSVYYMYSYMPTYLKDLESRLPSDMNEVLLNVSVEGYSGKLQLPTTQMLRGNKYDFDTVPDIPVASKMLEVFRNGRTRVCKTAEGTAVEWWTSNCEKYILTKNAIRPVYVTTKGDFGCNSEVLTTTTKYVRLLCFV